MPEIAFKFYESKHQTVIFAVDSKCVSEIITYLHNDEVYSEWRLIRDLIVGNLRNAEKYMKCKVTESANNMYEMRFTNKGRNDRIYCQEVKGKKGKIIVLCVLVDKKSQDIVKKNKNKIDSYSKIIYEIK